MIRQAFRTARTMSTIMKSENTLIKTKALTSHTMDGALKVITESYLPYENLSRAVNINSEQEGIEEFLKICRVVARDGCSIIATDAHTEEVVGVIFNKIKVPAPKDDRYFSKVHKMYKNEPLKAVFNFAIDVEDKANLFNLYNVNCLLEIMFLATKPDFTQRKIAHSLVASTMELSKQLFNGKAVKTQIGDELITNYYNIPELVTGIVTSKYSQKLGVTLGFDKVLEVNYSDYSYKGKKFSDNIDAIHTSCGVVAKKLD